MKFSPKKRIPEEPLKLKDDVADIYSPVKGRIRFITKAPNREMIDLSKVSMARAPSFEERGFLKKKKTSSSKGGDSK